MLRLSPVRRTVEILRQRAQTGTDERAANLQSSHAPPAVLRLRGVTEGLSYDALKMKYDIPCCRDVYYAAYRRFFWLLSKRRD